MDWRGGSGPDRPVPHGGNAATLEETTCSPEAKGTLVTWPMTCAASWKTLGAVCGAGASWIATMSGVMIAPAGMSRAATTTPTVLLPSPEKRRYMTPINAAMTAMTATAIRNTTLRMLEETSRYKWLARLRMRQSPPLGGLSSTLQTGHLPNGAGAVIEYIGPLAHLRNLVVAEEFTVHHPL